MKCLLFLSILLWGQNRSVKPSVDRYIPKYHTTAHRFLGLEEQYSQKTPDEKAAFYDPMYRKLDALIDTVSVRVGPYVAAHPAMDKMAVGRLLYMIDSVLTEQYFLVCIEMGTLSDAFTPRGLDHLPCARMGGIYRSAFANAHPTAGYYAIDCDLGAFLYFSIGEVLHLPIRFIEVPGHNFVRWEFGPGKYMNWDNNAAMALPDDFYRTSKGFNHQEEIRNHFLEPMSDSAMLGYYLSVIAIDLSHQGRYLETEQLYLRSMAIRPYDALPANNLAWMYVVVPMFKSKVKYQKAYALSQKVDSLLPSDIEFRDTYSCSCAAVGLFDKAIEIENTARKKTTRLDGYALKKTCLDLGEKLWNDMPTPN